MKQQDELATKKDLEKVEGRLQNVENGLQKVENKLQKVEEKLSAKIDANSAKIDRVEQTLSTKIDANSAKIDANAAKIDANSRTLNRLTSLVLDNGERMATKEDMDKRLDEIVSGIDGLARSFSILEQERVVTNKRLDRIEAKLV